jgi:hypothetical protein
MKLAHFSDVHIGSGTAREDARRFCRLVDHAIDRGAEHLSSAETSWTGATWRTPARSAPT